MSSLLQDVRDAGRSIRDRPGFAALAALTLALGIGANSAIFSVVNTTLLKPFAYPVHDQHNVYRLREVPPRGDSMSISYPSFKDWQEQTGAFETIAGFRGASFNLVGRDEPAQVPGRMVSASYFGLLGVKPLHGRFFTEEEDQPGAPDVAVLNYEIWQDRFGSDADVVGRQVTLDDRVYEVVGVLPADFELIKQQRIYVPLEPWPARNDSARDRGNHQGLFALARTRPGVTMEQARAELKTTAGRLETQYPRSNSGVGADLERLVDFRVEDYRQTLLVLLAAVGCVLLIACANVANLLLARAAVRQRDVAVRTALGASRWRLLRRSFTESLMLALLGGLLGIAFAYWGLALFRGLLPENLPRLHELAIDHSVLGFTFALCCLCALAFGSAPALLQSQVSLADFLKEGGRTSSTSHGRRPVGRIILIAEIALATVLLIAAGLLIGSVGRLMRVETGFQSENLLTMQMDLIGYEREERTAFYRTLQEKVRALPGVGSVSIGSSIPMLGRNWGSIFIVADKPVPPRPELPSSAFNPVGAGYFETLGIPLIRGRVFDRTDRADSQPVIVINQALADQIWPGEDPIGKRLKQGWPESEGEGFPFREVVGVVGNIRERGLDDEERSIVYIPYEQNPWSFTRLVVRTSVEPLTLVEPIKAAVRELNASLPVYEVETMRQIIDEWMTPRRFSMLLLSVFAGLALLLAGIGIYGLVSYTVTQRTQEMGLRMAIGAQRIDVFRLILERGALMAIVGVAIGVGVALGVTRWMEDMLYGISPVDPVVYAGVGGFLFFTAVVACLKPAIRATRVDPIQALRYE